MSTPTTQTQRPWRTVVRTVFQALIGLAALAPFVVDAAGLDTARLPWLLGFLAVCAGITRVMALPQVEDWLGKYLRFLAADPPPKPGPDA